MTEREKQPTIWSMILVPLGIAAIMTPAILLAASGSREGFDAVVESIEGRYHAHATRIPFMGLISLVAGGATHGGVRGLHVAEFENFRHAPDVPVDGQEFNALIEAHMGRGWQRMIRETSRAGGDQTLIYVRPEGQRMGMLVVDLSGKELDVVQMSMDPDQLMKEVAKHHHEPGEQDPGDRGPGDRGEGNSDSADADAE